MGCKGLNGAAAGAETRVAAGEATLAVVPASQSLPQPRVSTVRSPSSHPLPPSRPHRVPPTRVPPTRRRGVEQTAASTGATVGGGEHTGACVAVSSLAALESTGASSDTTFITGIVYSFVTSP
ncbi:hypothetical protein C0Q70_13497 [Pomacea canaliculata]|uniref:Uncharacterized protein n=1 Tax=Pomacea canaliculata TaxID=400727 RepID=A0A2T7NXE2_POMCA|nr:hypothetical protein C0Q70_13497 [Pomacea canaliculata]